MALRATSLPLTFSNPTTLIPSNLQLWLDASDTTNMTVASGNVSAWTDKSGTGNNATSPVGRNPSVATNTLNSRSVMTFSGSQNLTAAISLGGTTFTQFVVYSNSSVTVGQAYMDSSDGPVGKLCAQNGGGNQFQVGFAYGSTFQTGGAYRIVSTNCSNPGSSSTVSVWFNGTNQNIGSWNFYGASTTAITSVTIGARKDLIYFTGTIAEIIVYSTALTSPQQQTIEGYLAQKWGLTSSLPAGHPGLTTTIYTPIASGRRTFLEKIPYFVKFSPTQISGLVVWLDGADPAGNGVVPANGATVSTWVDKSGSGNNGTAVNTPTYALSSRGVATSSGAYFTLPNGAFPFNDSSYTYFFVFTTTTTGSVNSLFGGGVPGSTRSTVAVRLGTNGANNVIQTYWWANGVGDLLVTNTYSANVISIAETWYATGGTRTITLNFSGSNTDSPAAPGARLQANTNNFLGLAFPGDGALTGFHYEFLVYNTSLSTTNRQQVESYLAQKWNLVRSLPTTGHVHNTFPAGSPAAIQAFIPSIRPAVSSIPFIGGGSGSSSGIYSIRTFLTTGQLILSKSISATILVVGGGGGGGSAGVQTGGGGAGGAVFVSSPVTITAGIYTVTVGTGGGINTNGTNSTFLSYTGVGGGGGGNWINGAGKTGGCGGGGSGEGGSGAAGSQGFGGANGRGQFTCGGGGGGMGQAGKQPADGSPSSGGNGLQYSITGSSVYYAGGGAGGFNGASTGGLGGGGDKTLQGTDGLGGGGGSGARGGNGVVILSFVFL